MSVYVMGALRTSARWQSRYVYLFQALYNSMTGIVSAKRDLMHGFSRFQFFFVFLKSEMSSTHCTENRSICHGVVRL